MSASETSTATSLDLLTRSIAVSDVLATIADSTDLPTFVDDTSSQWAVEMGLIRIGQVINRLPDDVLADYPDQPWRQIIEMRNFAAHQYDDLDPRRVWRTLTSDIPPLRRYLADVMIPGLGR